MAGEAIRIKDDSLEIAQADVETGAEAPSSPFSISAETVEHVRRVILVEDDDGLRPIAERYLRVAVPDAEILTFIDASDAVAAIEARREEFNGSIVAVLSDQRMCRMMGMDLYEFLRSDPQFYEVPFTLMSGGMPQDDQDAVNVAVGGDRLFRFMPKPFGSKQLISVVQEVIHARQSIHGHVSER